MNYIIGIARHGNCEAEFTEAENNPRNLVPALIHRIKSQISICQFRKEKYTIFICKTLSKAEYQNTQRFIHSKHFITESHCDEFILGYLFVFNKRVPNEFSKMVELTLVENCLSAGLALALSGKGFPSRSRFEIRLSWMLDYDNSSCSC